MTLRHVALWERFWSCSLKGALTSLTLTLQACNLFPDLIEICTCTSFGFPYRREMVGWSHWVEFLRTFFAFFDMKDNPKYLSHWQWRKCIVCKFSPLNATSRHPPKAVPGFVLVWPIFGALVTHGLGRRLIPLSLAGESANANFRSELVHARDKVGTWWWVRLPFGGQISPFCTRKMQRLCPLRFRKANYGCILCGGLR